MPNINFEILPWARDTAKLSLDAAAQKLQIKDSTSSTAAAKLLAYENGTKEPTRAMLLKMAKLYRRPLLAFYLDKPPLKGNRGEDFRTLPDNIEPREDAYVDMLIRELKARQSMVRDALIDEDEATILDFVGSSNIDDGVKKVCSTLRKVLNLDLNEYRSQSTYQDAFKFLRKKAEEAGIFVLLQGNLGSHHTDISVSVFRGFALADNIAPFILINDLDAKSAWSFTLIHEMTHLALGQTGVSGAIAGKKIEKFCNEVASEFLLPSAEFRNGVFNISSFVVLTQEIGRYALSKKISNSHIAYRLYKRGDLNKAQWKKLTQHFKELWIEKKDKERIKNRQKRGGPSYYILKQYKLGSLVDLVQRLTYSGAISTTKAGMLLNVKPLKVHRLFNTNIPI